MKHCAFLISAFLCVTAAAQTSVSVNSTRRFKLSGASCAELLADGAAICNWKAQLEKTNSIAPTTCTKLSAGKYTLDITTCVPQFARDQHAKRLLNSGANCWGTALSLKGYSSTPRFVWSEEMEYWQASPVCRKLTKNEALQTGDIINVYGPEYLFGEESENEKGVRFWQALYPGRFLSPSLFGTGYSGFHRFLHSETYLSPRLTFGKDSPSELDRFSFHNLNEVYGRPRERECQENADLAPYSRESARAPRAIKGSRCDYFSVAYRCENVEVFWQNQSLTADQQNLRQEITELQREQKLLFALQTRVKSWPKDDVHRLLALADAASESALSELRSLQPKITEMLLVQKYFSAQAIRKTLEQARLTPATEAL